MEINDPASRRLSSSLACEILPLENKRKQETKTVASDMHSKGTIGLPRRVRALHPRMAFGKGHLEQMSVVLMDT